MPGNENAHLSGEHFTRPCYSQGDVHGRIRFDGFATAKTWVVIAILGLGADEVKGKNLACDVACKLLYVLHLSRKSEVGCLWKNCGKPDSSTVRFPSKGAERQGLLIPDPQQLKGVVMAGLSKLSSQNPKASEPDSDDDTKGA